MILELVAEAVRSGAHQKSACEILGLNERTLQRWRRQGGGEDRRRGPKTPPPNKLTPEERQQVLEIVNSPQFCDVSPKQIVPQLADQGVYVASESTIYRLLRQAELLAHRQRARPPVLRRPRECVATGPGQVWTWDITYLPGPVRGTFFYLYLILDLWSRKIVAARVFREESMHHAAKLFEQTCTAMQIDPKGMVLHADNGGPMKGSTMLATLQRLGVVPSFSRPRVCDDNPFSEALFRTLKYRPEYPSRPFETIELAQAWVDGFTHWYNHKHLHSALRFLTPDDRHSGRQNELLERRQHVYQLARQRRPLRWTGPLRNWQPVGDVCLNPKRDRSKSNSKVA
jgi:transposase InsO family protein